MKILLKVQATSEKKQTRRGRPSTKAVASEGEEKFLELDIGETVVMIGFPPEGDEKTRVAVERSELEKALKFIVGQ